MASYTPKLGLRVDEETDELWAARSNWDKLDNSFSGVLWVAPGITPTPDILYDGSVVAEIGNGKVWRAEKNILGNYDKKWIKYPWQVTTYGAGNFPAVGTTPQNWGFDALDYSQSFNADATNLVGTQVVVPVTGLYLGSLSWRWEASGVGGFKSYQMLINDTLETANTETVRIATTFNNMSTHFHRFNKVFNAGDRIAGSAWRNTAGAQTYSHRCAISLVRPT